jgi:CPA1 family monovalent cation:H+ antiporter
MAYTVSLAVPVLVVCGLLALATLAFGLLRGSPLPFTVLLAFVGVVLHHLADFFPGFAWVVELQLEPEVVFFLLLPALIFQSAYTLQTRELVKNLLPILVLAVPALVISAMLIGLGLWQWVGLPLVAALLFGALISATDPVAVVALFKELGAPKRLTMLVEGESLLNDGTALVLVKIILATALMGAFTTGTILTGVWQFFVVAVGGNLLGIILSLPLNRLIHYFGGGGLIATAFTVIAAYGGFIIAEHYLDLSGVMATVSSGIVLGSLAPTAVQAEARSQVHSFWEFAEYVCNCLLFLLLGLSVDLQFIAQYGYMILVAIFLVLTTRALLVYTLVPLLSRFWQLEKVSFRYQSIMFWGGLKGGLAVAIALSLPMDFAWREVILGLTIGVVLFTLLVNAATIKPLMRLFGLDRPGFYERLEHRHIRKQLAQTSLAYLANLHQDGYITEAARQFAESQLALPPDDLDEWEVEEPDMDQRRLYGMRQALGLEYHAYQTLYEQGLLPELLALTLKREVSARQERLALSRSLPNDVLNLAAFSPQYSSSLLHVLETILIRLLRRADWLEIPMAYLQDIRLSQELERLIAASMAYRQVIKALQAYRDDPVYIEVQSFYRKLDDEALARLGRLHEQFPAFATWVERRLAVRSALELRLTQLEKRYEQGDISDKPYLYQKRELRDHIVKVQHAHHRTFHQQRTPLLQKVPLFAELRPEELAELSAVSRLMYYLPGDVVIQQGEVSNALFIIAGGQVEVLGEKEEGKGLLNRGDFFGEIALLQNTPRTATVRVVSPSTLLRLRRKDVLAMAARHARVQQLLEQAARLRTPSHRTPPGEVANDTTSPGSAAQLNRGRP